VEFAEAIGAGAAQLLAAHGLEAGVVDVEAEVQMFDRRLEAHFALELEQQQLEAHFEAAAAEAHFEAGPPGSRDLAAFELLAEADGLLPAEGGAAAPAPGQTRFVSV
jgi:hypothetical protein